MLIGSRYKSGANRRGMQMKSVAEDGKIHASMTFITLSNYAWVSTILVLFTIEFLWVWACAVDKYHVFTIIARYGLVKKSSFISEYKILLFVGYQERKFFTCLQEVYAGNNYVLYHKSQNNFDTNFVHWTCCTLYGIRMCLIVQWHCNCTCNVDAQETIFLYGNCYQWNKCLYHS